MGELVVIRGVQDEESADAPGLAEFLRSRIENGLDVGGLLEDQVERAVAATARGRLSIRLGNLGSSEADALMDLLDRWGFQYELQLGVHGPEPSEGSGVPAYDQSARGESVGSDPAGTAPTSDSGALRPSRECMVGPCEEPRADGSTYCDFHSSNHPYGGAGRGDRQIVCPHCQSRGSVRTKEVRVKSGISGGKATGAVLTGGLSVVATGLSRKENRTQARCSKCRTVWFI